jgi:hypothetical protein
MEASPLDLLRRTNARLRILLLHARDALSGRSKFDVTDVRAIAEPVKQAAPIVAEAKALRASDPDLSAELDIYKVNLSEMQVALERIRFMLIARRAHVESMRSHLETLGLWSSTFRMTR